MRHLKTFNQKAASSTKQNKEESVAHVELGEVGHAPGQTGSTSERDRESTCSTSEGAPKVNTGGEEGASAASATAGETERETGFTSTTASISPTPLPELEPTSSTSQGERVSLRFFIRGHSSSNYHIEAAPSDANLVASQTSEPEAESTSEP